MGRPKNRKNIISTKIRYFCKTCNQEFFAHPYRKNVQYCSYKCYWNGRTYSKELRNKFSLSAKGKHIGKKNGSWNGGRRVDGFGYIKIYSPNHPNKDKQNTVKEHRLVMEKHIGRYLTGKEVVHHINGIKGDNRIENLFLCASNSEHRKLHKIIRDANSGKILSVS